MSRRYVPVASPLSAPRSLQILFLLFALGGVQVINANLTANANSADSTGTKPVGSDSARLLAYFYIAMGFGLSLFGIASIFYRFTGSIMNPSVSLALVLVGVIKPVRFIRESLGDSKEVGPSLVTATPCGDLLSPCRRGRLQPISTLG